MALVSSTSSLGGLAGGNALARLLVVISGETSGLERAVARAQGTLKGFGSQMGTIGSALTRSLTLPIVALGGAATFFAVQFQQSLARIAGLTPILDTTGQSIEQIGDALLEMSKRVPTGPVELADALYFAGSAGLDFARAMEVVELSAGGAAIGMGEASDIAKVLIFSLNAFESQGLTAAEAMDALTVAVREGTAEPEDLAVALGRLLPVAKEAGITFQEVVGAVASLTNIGFPARVATVALRALFAELLAPTQQATERLNLLGVSAEQLRDSMEFGGPIAAFKLLNRAVRDDEDALRDILPQIRGFSAFVGITGDRLETTIDIMHKATNSTGAFERALAQVRKSPQFQFDIGLNKLKVAAIDVGRLLVPIFIRIGEVIGAVADRISALPGPAQAVGVAFLGMVAALGPLLKLMAALGLGTQPIVAGFKSISATFLTMGASALIAFAGFQSLAEGSTSLFSTLTTLVASATAAFTALRLLQSAALNTAFGMTTLGSALVTNLGTGGMAAIAAGIGLVVTALALFVGRANQAAKAADQAGTALVDAAKQGNTLKRALQEIDDESVRSTLKGIAREMDLLGESAGVALPLLQRGLGTQLIADLRKMNTALKESDEFVPGAEKLDEFIPLVQKAAAEGTTLAKAFTGAGKDVGDFFFVLDAVTASDTVEGLGAIGDRAVDLAHNFSEVRTAIAAYNDAQEATIAATALNRVATEEYAKELGISAEDLQAHLDAVGVSAAGMTEDNKQAFEALEFTVDGAVGEVNAKLKLMQEAAAESMKNIRDSVSGAFGAFEKAEDQVKGTAESLLGIFQKNVQAVVNEVTNLSTLAARGVPLNVLEFLADQGPQMVQKFVDASGGQLKRLVTLYQVQLAAVDAAILEESAHQQTKGASMVEKFVDGILTNSSLPINVARNIVQTTIAEFNKGNITQAGLHQITLFAKGLGTGKPLTQKEGAAAIRAFISELQKGNIAQVGRKQVEEFANAIASAADIPKAKARELVNNVVNEGEARSREGAARMAKLLRDNYASGIVSNPQRVKSSGDTLATKAREGLKSGAGDTKAVGTSFAMDFASGVGSSSAKGIARSNARQLGEAAKEGLNEGLVGSPRYFSYYAALQFASDFEDGAKKGKPSMKNAGEALVKGLREATVAGDQLEKLGDDLANAIQEGLKNGMSKMDVEFARSLNQLVTTAARDLDRVKKKFDEFQDSIRSGFDGFKDLIGGFGTLLTDFEDQQEQYMQDLKEYAQAYREGQTGLTIPVAPTAPDPQDFLREQLDNAQTLAQMLTKLSKLGLAPTLIAQLAGQGADAIPIAEALIAGGKDLIKDFNGTLRDLNQVTNGVVGLLGNRYFGDAINEAVAHLDRLTARLQRFIERLREQVTKNGDELAAALERLANRIQAISDSFAPKPGGKNDGKDGGGKSDGRGDRTADASGAFARTTSPYTYPYNYGAVGEMTYPPIQVKVVLDSGELIAFVDEGIGKRGRIQGRLAHSH